ncbi:MAG: hypothetical protein IPJ34_08805 [Myxococcales bacterium]|nr:hypothetical protein [Myxococcales bacterium]
MELAALPAKVSEFYARDPEAALLRRFSNCDEPFALASLGTLSASEVGAGAAIATRMVVFMTENQGVCHWGFDAEGGEDPPVYVAVDGAPWRLHNASFASFLECQVWDWSEHAFMATAQASALSEAEVSSLRALLVEGPTTHGWPGERQRRFSSDDGSVLLWESDDQTDWMLRADTRAGFERLVAWMGQVRQSSDGWFYAVTEPAALALEAMAHRS